MTPQRARTQKEHCSLRRDNLDVPGGWVMVDGDSITLSNQNPGEAQTGKVTFRKRDFDRLIRWYTGEDSARRLGPGRGGGRR